jgi:hypothetical protein
MTTTKFADLTRQVAENFSLPDCRIVIVDHPLGGTPEATVVARAEAAVEQIIAAFTGSTERHRIHGRTSGT